MRRTYLLMLLSFCLGQTLDSQTLTFLLRNGQIIPGPKFQFEVWVKSSDGTSRMGSILAYNNYSTDAFGQSIVTGGRVTVTKNAAIFGATYGQNPSNDNTSSRFAYSWTYLGAAGTGVVIPSTGDGVLAFTVQIDIQNTSAHAALSFQGTLMDGEQYKDDETTVWPVIDATSILDDPLPIQLTSFTAMATSAGDVRLDWTTLSEINNYGFEVQRRRGEDSLFQTLSHSFIPGHGTTNEPHDYTYTDTTATHGQLSYRLKQTDLDGSIHYSDAVTVHLTTAAEEPQLPTVFSLAQNYPNPFNPTSTIRYDLPVPSHVTITLYSVIGEEVAAFVNETQDAGFQSVMFDAKLLASGVYFYRIEASPVSEGPVFASVKKMVLLK